MIKQVYCVISLRKKVIKFDSSTDTCSDLSMLRQSLFNACKSDKVLNSMLNKKFLVFQKLHCDAGWIDIEEEEEIVDKSEVKVLLFSQEEYCAESSDPLAELQFLSAQNLSNMPIDILYEPSAKQSKIEYAPEVQSARPEPASDLEIIKSNTQVSLLESNKDKLLNIIRLLKKLINRLFIIKKGHKLSFSSKLKKKKKIHNCTHLGTHSPMIQSNGRKTSHFLRKLENFETMQNIIFKPTPI